MTRWLFVVVLVGGAVALLLIAAGQLGLLAGKPPTNLGVRNGRLAPPAATPNSVSSQANLYPDNPQAGNARIDPLPFTGDGHAAMARLANAIRQMPGARIISAEPGYLHAEFQSTVLRFTDDLELWLDSTNGVIQVRSASRLGKDDMGVNRARVEKIRALNSH